jgi:hypothetical protein
MTTCDVFISFQRILHTTETRYEKYLFVHFYLYYCVFSNLLNLEKFCCTGGSTRKSLPSLATREKGTGQRAFDPTLLWALHAFILLSPLARKPTEARGKSPTSPLSNQFDILVQYLLKMFGYKTTVSVIHFIF